MGDIYQKVIRVFIASPGGLGDEREAVRVAIDDVNRQNSAYWGIRFEAVGWEETIGGNRRAQSLINKDLESCDYFFGILYDRWGSPPQGDGEGTEFTSGFDEEYHIAESLHKKGEMNDLFLFFKAIPEERLRDPGEELKRVLEFRKQRTEARRPLYFEFPDREQFKTKIRDYLANIGWSLFTEHSEGDGEQRRPDVQAPPAQEAKKEGRTRATSLFGGDTEAFLRRLLAMEYKYDAVNPLDVARLRLIAASLHRSSNDIVQIGAHDANLLFRARNEISPSNREVEALVNAGLASLGAENIPLWFWVNAGAKAIEPLAPIQDRMFFGRDPGRRYTLRLARYLGLAPPTFDDFITRARVIESWFDEEASPDTRSEAMTYLREMGLDEDCVTLDSIKTTYPKIDSAELDETIIAIRMRESLNVGLDELAVRDPEKVSEPIRMLITGSLVNIETARLTSMLKLKASDIRLLAAEELRRRGGLDADLAEELSGDSSAAIRYEAIIALVDHGKSISTERARSALESKQPRRSLLSFNRNNKEDTLFAQFQRYVLRSYNLKKLLELAEDESPHSADVFFTACEKYPRQMLTELRTELRSGFRRLFDTKVEKLKQQFGSTSPELISKTVELAPFSCLQHLNEGIGTLALRMNRADIGLMRLVLDSWEITANKPLLKYMGRFGGWEDVGRIKKLKLAGYFSRPSVHEDRNANIDDVGRTLRALARRRFTDLLAEITDPSVKAAVYCSASIQEIAQRSDEHLLEDLNSESEKLRKTVALRCVQSISKSRVAKLLKKYIDHESYRYYNVIHWLDLGESMPTEVSKALVSKELET
ncbi:DUF4062 domain-containing protein [Mesorhizobium sp. Z1-4]|uniref:DUF4062 domain-containing protein n=1 Tax=Mesorhizobium sp. Z1-4 TaxID=2448478 RepID=UPI000FD9741E|nr:DUF4062 domain-containing protein [Mesorhizobium sp. Z1-4]